MAVTIFGVGSGPVVLNSELLNVFFFFFFQIFHLISNLKKKNAKRHHFGSSNRFVTEP